MKFAEALGQHLWLLDIIYREGPISRKDINVRWMLQKESLQQPISRTTMYRHMSEIEDMFNINIDCDDKNRYFISNPENLHYRTLQSLLLANLNEARFLTLFRGLGSQVQVESIPRGEEYLHRIGKCIKDKTTMMMTYQKFTDTDPYTVEIEPYCLKSFERRWYIVARKLIEDKFKCFALDRIVALEPTNNIFTPRPFDADNYFNDYLGIYVDPSIPAVDIVIQAKEIPAKYLRTLPLHHSQEEIEYCKFRFHISPTPDLINHLFGLHPGIKVLSPESVVEEIKEKSSEMLKIYERKNYENN